MTYSKLSGKAATCERLYQKTGMAIVQVRTAGGRLVAYARHVEAAEFHVHAGRGRVLYRRISDYSGIHWI